MKINFEVSAKAARLIGRENIADADGALSELIKNAYDADASCVYVDFYMPFPDVPTKTSTEKFSSILSPEDYKRVLEYYDFKDNFLLRKSDLTVIEKTLLQNILFSYNKIIVIDNGEGMNMDIVCSSWMQIATSNKETRIMTRKGRVKTGAKGIGRFALDKLSMQSVMYTKSATNKTIKWAVDWEQFSSAHLLSEVNAEIDEIDCSLWEIISNIIPSTAINDLSSYNWDTGTVFLLSPTRESWNTRLFEKVNTNLKSINPLGSVDQFDVIINHELMPEYSYRTTPVAIDKKDYDYKIVVEYNGENTLTVEIHRNEFDKNKLKAVFSVNEKYKEFQLKNFWNRDAFKYSPYRKQDYCDSVHLIEIPVDSFIDAYDFDKVRAVGPFNAELYFVKNGKSDFPFVKDVPTRRRKDLLSRFSGIKLYRDNFKVRPYGDEGDLYDWLSLNERANKSPAGVSHSQGAWRVLPYQMIGVVKISRTRNAALYDMANREGLTKNESYFYFVEMLQEAISRFEFDRQYIYREFDKWKKECVKTIAGTADRIKEDVRNRKKNPHNNEQSEHNEENSNNKFTEEEYRDAVETMMQDEERELKAKQTLEILSSAGVILNTFFHEFSSLSTSLHTRGSQMRARLDFLLNGQPYSGPQFLDPYRKLESFDKVDSMLDGWLKVVMDAISEDNFKVDTISIVDYLNKLKNSWQQLLEEKGINISIKPENLEEHTVLLKIAVVDLYVIINNFMLNSVWFLEKGNQSSREILFNLTDNDREITLRMENNGPPMDDKYKGQPMLMFEIGQSTKPDGTGLGLWLMRDAVERSDGQISPLNKTDGFGIEIKWSK